MWESENSGRQRPSMSYEYSARFFHNLVKALVNRNGYNDAYIWDSFKGSSWHICSHKIICHFTHSCFHTFSESFFILSVTFAILNKSFSIIANIYYETEWLLSPLPFFLFVWQRFPTEDHLMIHRHKHEMTLKFPSIKTDNMLSGKEPPGNEALGD